MNGQDHAHEAEKWLTTSHHHTDSSSPADAAIALHTALQAQAHATLAVAYAQAGAWAGVPSPTAADLTCSMVHPTYRFGPCCRIRGHEADHVGTDGASWRDV